MKKTYENVEKMKDYNFFAVVFYRVLQYADRKLVVNEDDKYFYFNAFNYNEALDYVSNEVKKLEKKAEILVDSVKVCRL